MLARIDSIWATPSLYQIFGDQIFGTGASRPTETMELTDDDEMPELEDDVNDGMDVD